jgi:hypothetical protein
VNGATKKMGIEVPVLPVVREGLDQAGTTLNGADEKKGGGEMARGVGRLL